jgi:hypothetical protein
MLIYANKKTPKTPKLLECEFCDFKCSKKSDYNRHLLTLKHSNANKMLINANILEPKNATPYSCNYCNKTFQHLSSLSRHKKTCKYNAQISPELIMNVLQQNKELQQMIMQQNNTIIELSKNTTIINNESHINSHINSHNKSFNLNFFLNETCKDAMNIMDFVNSLKIQLSDLENMGKLGFVQGISNIIVQNLNSLDETMRPIHCTDSKREVMYVKDDNKWEKENDNKQKIRKAIKYVAHKNTKLLPEFRAKYPNCDKSSSKLSDKYDKLVIEAFGGKGDNDAEKEDKIIRNIAKEVSIDKLVL